MLGTSPFPVSLGTRRHHCVECGLGCERHGVNQILGLRLSPSPEAFHRPHRMRRFEVLEAVARPGREAGTCSGRRERGWRKEVRKRRLWLEKRKRSGRGCRLFRGRTWWNDDEACSGSLAHRRVGDRACLTCRCACGGGVVVWWEEERAGGEDGGRRRAGGQQKCGHSRAQLRTREHFIICGLCRGAAASEFQGA